LGISAGDDNNVRFWQATDAGKNIGKQAKNIGGHAKGIFRMAINNTSKPPILATCAGDGVVKVSDAVSGAALKTLTGLGDYAYAVAVSPDGTLVAGGAWNGEVRIWKVADGNVQAGFNASPGYVAPKAPEKTPEKK